MYYERRKAFEARIKQLLSDHLAAVGQKGIQGRFVRDLTPRILSALEDAFQMGRRDGAAPADEIKP